MFGLFLFAASVSVQADDLFDRGVEAFKKSDFSTAVKFFEQSRGQGNDSPILSYNLGAGYYKLGDYVAARQHFTDASRDDSLAGLSYYNLGLLSLRDNDEAQAYDYFSSSFAAARDEKVRILAALKMQELDARRPAAKSSDRFFGFVSLAAANDDNVTRINEDLPAVSNEVDSYFDFFGVASYQLTGDSRNGIQAKAGMVATRFNTLTQYDETVFNLGLYLYRPVARWQTRLGIVHYYDRLAGDPFQRRTALQLRGDHQYADRRRLRLYYDLTHYSDMDKRYAYLNGWRQRFNVENRSRTDHNELRLGYTLELNSRDDYSSGSTYYPYSPTRQSLYVFLKRNFSRQWAGEIGLDYRHSDYGDAAILSGMNQGTRVDNRKRYSLIGTWRYSRDTEFEASWRYADNDSSFSSESYTSNLYMLSVNHYF